MVALGLEDVYIRVDFRFLMKTLVDMRIDRYIIIVWIGNQRLKRKVALLVRLLRRLKDVKCKSVKRERNLRQILKDRECNITRDIATEENCETY